MPLAKLQRYVHRRLARQAGLKLGSLTQLRKDACLHIELPASLGNTRVTAINPPQQPLTIGAHTYIRSGTIAMVAEIGRFCSFGQDVSLGEDPRAHPPEWASTSPALTQGYTSPFQHAKRYTRIGHDVWVGHGAVIMAGVNIGTGAIIGGNAVVTKDVPPYHIAVGNPARVVRMRFSEEIAADLLDSAWWQRAYTDLRSLNCQDPAAFANEAKALGSQARYPLITLHQQRVISIDKP